MRTERTTNLYPVILPGGSGARVWPLSRAKYPKQFVRFDGQDKSFLAASLTRDEAAPRQRRIARHSLPAA